KHDRFVGGGTGCADSNPHRRSSRRERRVRERDVCQAAGESMLRYRFTMKRGVLALVAAVSAFAWLDAAPLTPEQTLDRRSIGELEFSSDGARLVFTVAQPVKGTARPRSVWLVDPSARSRQASDGGLRQLTFSGKNDESPRWSPDGSSIAFLSDRDGSATQLYLLPMRGGEAEKITDRKEAVTTFRWSPDGSRIALLMPE